MTTAVSVVDSWRTGTVTTFVHHKTKEIQILRNAREIRGKEVGLGGLEVLTFLKKTFGI
jgi:hypothetical protein